MLDQTARGINIFHWAFLPQDASDYTIQRLSRIWPKLLRSKRIEEMAEIKRELDAGASVIEETDILYAYYAYLHMNMKDYGRALDYIKKAIDLSNGLPRYRIVLSRILGHQQQHEEQIRVCKELIDEIGVDPSVIGDAIVKLLLTGYFLPHIWTGKYEDVIEQTKDWKKSSNKSILGPFRASAIKRASERMRDSEAVRELNRCVGILDEVIRESGYDRTVCLVSAKVMDDFAYRVNSPNVEVGAIPKTDRILEFCDRHLYGCMKIVGRDKDCKRMAEVFASLEVEDNPFRQHRWLKDISYAKASDSIANELAGYVTVDVYHIPTLEKDVFPTYIFARDEQGEEYFLFQSFLNNQSTKAWHEVREGDSLRVIPDLDRQEPGKAIPVSDILL